MRVGLCLRRRGRDDGHDGGDVEGGPMRKMTGRG